MLYPLSYEGGTGGSLPPSDQAPSDQAQRIIYPRSRYRRAPAGSSAHEPARIVGSPCGSRWPAGPVQLPERKPVGSCRHRLSVRVPSTQCVDDVSEVITMIVLNGEVRRSIILAMRSQRVGHLVGCSGQHRRHGQQLRIAGAGKVCAREV